MANFDTTSAEYNPSLRMLETSDPCHASTFNAGLGQLIGNDVALKGAVDAKVEMASPMLELNTAAASSTTDGKLYAAITALGWESEVIVNA